MCEFSGPGAPVALLSSGKSSRVSGAKAQGRSNTYSLLLALCKQSHPGSSPKLLASHTLSVIAFIYAMLFLKSAISLL